MESGVLKWRKVWGRGGDGLDCENDARYQRGYLYRRGGSPKGGAGYHEGRIYGFRGSLLTYLVRFLDHSSSSVFL